MPPDSAGERLACARITSAEALEGLCAEWDELWARCPDATPFQSPAWLVPWWRTFGNGELYVLTFRDGGRLVALVPLYLGAAHDGGARVVRLLGSGNSDYVDGLFLPGFEIAAANLCFAELGQLHAHWDRCDLLELRPASPLLHATAPAAWHDEIGEAGIVSQVPLTGSEPDAGIRRPFLKKLRYFARLAERSGGLRVQRADEASFEESFATMVRLHETRWAARAERGVLADPAVHAFNREAARALLRRGLLRLHTLFVGSRAAASSYGFLHGARAYCYLTGFDPAFGRLSPGHLVLQHAIREAAREGARTFDLLRGREAYKARWRSAEVANRRRTLSLPTVSREAAPHLPHLGRCGAHFAGLNAKSLSCSTEGCPAVDPLADHWRRHRPALYRFVGLVPPEVLST
jgi:CelD/BcsL family acetyltransferase involved in cellulose biosynthesis